MSTVELFYSDSFSNLEILAFTELIKSKQKHTNKLLTGLFTVKEKAVVFANRLSEGEQFKEAEFISRTKVDEKIYRRLSYGLTWMLLGKGLYLSFVFPNKIDWRVIIKQLLHEITQKDVLLQDGHLIMNMQEIGFYGTYSDPINTVVECYIHKLKRLDQIKDAIISFFEQENYDVVLSTKLSIYDENLLTSIINGKFSTDSWIIECHPPFLEGKCLIELLVAYPPTRYCKAFISSTKQAINELDVEDKTELVIYERGKRGQMLRHMISKGILTAFKSHRLPALVINGNLKAAKEVPPVEKIKEYITEELHKLNLL